MDMSITKIGPAFNLLAYYSYYRRRNALMAIMGDKKKVKDRMSENEDIIQENTSKRLFGEKIDGKITEHVKQFAGIHPGSLINIEKILNTITMSYDSLKQG